MDDLTEYISGLCENDVITEMNYKDLMDKLKVVNDSKDKYIKITYDKIINVPYQAEDHDAYFEDDIQTEFIRSLKTDTSTDLYVKIMDGEHKCGIKCIMEGIFRFSRISNTNIECLKKNINNLHIIVEGFYSSAVVIKSVEEL